MAALRVHALLHVPFEGLGEIEPWLLAFGHTLTKTRFYESDPLPETDEIDWLIIMGGPMSVHDEAIFPWLRLEKAFIVKAIKTGLRVLGICLGAQLIASVHGENIYPAAEKEIGWFPVTLKPAAERFFGDAPSPLEVFHWHGETFHLPWTATLLAESEACRHQAFCCGPRVVGLQFHLEMNAAAISLLVEHGREELIAAPFVQTERQIVRHELSLEPRAALHHLLHYLAHAPRTAEA